jgi:hypothetical protein
MLTITGTTSHGDKREIKLTVWGITILIAALVSIRCGVIANHVTAKDLTKVTEGTSDQVGLAIKDKGLCCPLSASNSYPSGTMDPCHHLCIPALPVVF